MKKKRRISRTQLKRLAFIGSVLLLMLIMVYSGKQILNATVLRNVSDADQYFEHKTIQRDGVEYFPRQDITTFLLLGIDREGPVQDSGSYHNSGAADLVVLAVFDEIEENYSILYLNRDTMLEMPVLGVGGKYAGTMYGQLALAHTYGGGLADSCENTRDAVSEFLYGLHIDHYVAMNMDVVTILNDAVDGVPVLVKDDFSAVDPTIGKGRVTLKGQQAINYVRSRAGVGDQLNASRMERQQAYIEGFLEKLQEKQQSKDNFFLSVYEDVEEYIVTDCSVNTIAGVVDRYSGYTLKQVISPKGENVKGEKYMEFHVDEAALDAVILDMFYAPKANTQDVDGETPFIWKLLLKARGQ